MSLETIRLENTLREKCRRTLDGLRYVVTVDGVYAGAWAPFDAPSDPARMLWLYTAGRRCSGVVATKEEARRRVLRSVRLRIRKQTNATFPPPLVGR